MHYKPYVGPVDLVGDPQERQHFHGRLYHKKTLFLGLQYDTEQRLAQNTGNPYIRMIYANGLFGSLSMPALEMICGYHPRTMPVRILNSLAETVCHSAWLAHVESFVMEASGSEGPRLVLENRVIDFQDMNGLMLFSEVYGRPKYST